MQFLSPEQRQIAQKNHFKNLFLSPKVIFLSDFLCIFHEIYLFYIVLPKYFIFREKQLISTIEFDFVCYEKFLPCGTDKKKLRRYEHH